MKKTTKTITIVVISLLLLVVVTAKAQIFLSDFDQGENPRVEADDYGFIIGYEGGDLEQYLPLGDGWLLLAGLGGAYLMRKRNRNREE